MAEVEELITLQCVKSRGKLRIRFHSYTNGNGKAYTNVYNNSYNCQFPRAIRREGCFYQVGKNDLTLVATGGRTPFYRIKTDNIRILEGHPDDVPAAAPQPKRKGRKPKASSSSSASAEPEPEPVAERPTQVYEVNECVICLDGKPEQIFIPCAHLCACSGCWAEMEQNKADCPLCRRTVVSAIPNVPE